MPAGSSGRKPESRFLELLRQKPARGGARAGFRKSGHMTRSRMAALISEQRFAPPLRTEQQDPRKVPIEPNAPARALILTAKNRKPISQPGQDR